MTTRRTPLERLSHPSGSRRGLLKAGLACAPLLLRAAQAAPSTAPAGALTPPELVAAWQRGFAAPAGDTFAWWYAGTLYAHVDGLREFPMLALNAVMICRTAMAADAIVVDWRTLGYFSDLDTGAPAAHWDNVFTGRRQTVPPRFDEGPGRYRLSRDDAQLTLTAQNVRANRTALTGSATADGVMLTQIEGTLQGLPRLDGTLPALGGSDITERQTRLQLVLRNDSFAAAAASLRSGPTSGAPGRAPPQMPPRRTSQSPAPASAAPVGGFFNHVYDALPPWLGFGERLGSVLSKGVMRKARADERVNPAVWLRINHLFGAAMADGQWRLVP